MFRCGVTFDTMLEPTNQIVRDYYMTAIVTAYCACRLCCGPNAHGVCADGARPRQGVTVAASRSIPLGTRVTIAGKTYVVQDRLAQRFDSRFDVFFASHAAAKRFGVQRLEVRIISPSPAAVSPSPSARPR